MVEIQLIIEGGHSVFQPKKTTEIDSNSNRLRLSFQKLLAQEIAENDLKRKVKIIMGGGWQEIKSYYEDVTDKVNSLILVDSDAPNEDKEAKRIERRLEPKENVFLMVQETEAWLLSQPEILDKYYGRIYGKKEDSIKELILEKPQAYVKPSSKLDELLKLHYSEKKIQKFYHKMNNDIELIPMLNLSKLKEDFDDVHRLINTLQTKIATNA